MNKDIVIINKETRDILAIITNKDLAGSNIVAIERNGNNRSR